MSYQHVPENAAFVGGVQGQAEVDPAEPPEIQSSCRPQPWEHRSHTFCNELTHLIAYL